MHGGWSQRDSNDKPRAQPLGTAVDELGLRASQHASLTFIHTRPLLRQTSSITTYYFPECATRTFRHVFATPKRVAQRTTTVGCVARQCSSSYYYLLLQPCKIRVRDSSTRSSSRWMHRMQGRSYSLLNLLVWKSPSCGEEDSRPVAAIIVPASLAAKPFRRTLQHESYAPQINYLWSMSVLFPLQRASLHTYIHHLACRGKPNPIFFFVQQNV